MKNLEDASDELALMDDDVKIPYYIGEVFVHQCLEKTLVIMYICNSANHIIAFYTYVRKVLDILVKIMVKIVQNNAFFCLMILLIFFFYSYVAISIINQH